MIKYRLICDNDHEFDGWFPNSEEFDRQKDKELIQCPECDSIFVDKAIMAPSVQKAKLERMRSDINGNQYMPASQAKDVLRKIGKYITKTYENVGDKFFDEAIKANEGERDDKFYGTATDQEIKELIDDGIDLFHVPEIKDN